MNWLELFDRVGLPATLLAALGYALWRGAAFMAPKLTTVTEAHLEFLQSLREQMARLTTHAERQTSLLEGQQRLLQEQSALLSQLSQQQIHSPTSP